MRFLASLIIFFSFSLKAEPIKIYGSVLNCKNIDWIIDRMADSYFRLLDENEFVAEQICKVGRNECIKNIDLAISESSNSSLIYSSLIGYAFTFHKPVCNNGVDYIKAAKYYVEALKMPTSGVSKDSTNVKHGFYYMGKLTALIEDAGKNNIAKSELNKLLEIVELLILNYGFESKEYKYTDDYYLYTAFLDHLWIGENPLPNSYLINWFKRAANCGWGNAQYDLGMTLSSGQLQSIAITINKPALENQVEGYKWLLIAKQTGYPVYDGYLNYYKNEMSSQQIVEAQDRAYNWQENCKVI